MSFRIAPLPGRSGWLAALCVLVSLLLVSNTSQAQPFTFTFVENNLTPLSYGFVAYADIDQNGRFDLVAGGNSRDEAPFLPNTHFARSLGEQAISGGWAHQFSETRLQSTLWHGDVAWADYDLDGHLDFILTGTSRQDSPFDGASYLYRNDGSGNFQQINAGLVGVFGSTAAWGDYDNDGDPDLLLTGSDASDAFFTRLYQNDNGSFSDVSADLPNLAYASIAWGDYDDDNDLDLLLSGAENGEALVTDIFRNDGGGAFTPINAGLPGLAFSSTSWGDYDNDGDLDILITGGTLSPQLFDGMVKVYRNNGGSFSEVNTNLPGIFYGTSAWGDYDNDGDLDILLAGSQGALGKRIGQVFQNNNGTFDQTINLPGLFFNASTWGDYDNDGDLDILFTGQDRSSNPVTSLYRNDQRIVNTKPAAPSGLQASVQGGTASLSWSAASDDQTAAAGLTYNLRVGTAPGSANVVNPLSSPDTGYRWIPARGNTDHGTSWHLTLPPGTYYWSVQAVDNSFKGSAFAEEGSFSISNIISTDTEGEGDLPQHFALHPSYPNPFRTSTSLGFDLPATTSLSLKVYDLLGKEVATLVDGVQPAGRQQVIWDGTADSGQRVSAGVYFVRMQSGDALFSQKLIVIN